MKNTKYQKDLPMQAGVSLIMVFFMMTVILSVVLGLGAIIFNESKNIKSIGDSIVSFYAADSGVEKTLYYSRKQIPATPEGITNGICNICDSCLSGEANCQNCQVQGEDCSFCRNCQITYTTTFDNKKFETLAIISPNGNFYNLDISVKGFYNKTSRAINLQIANKDLSSSNPIIENTSAIRSGNLVTISVDIIDPDGIDASTVRAHIRNSDDKNDPDIGEVWLSVPDGQVDTYTGIWQGEAGYYFIYVRACDLLGNCAESIKFPVTE